MISSPLVDPAELSTAVGYDHSENVLSSGLFCAAVYSAIKRIV